MDTLNINTDTSNILKNRWKSKKLQQNIEPSKNALRITIIYGVFSILWILFSSGLLDLVTEDITTMKKLEIYKGWLHVIITVFLLYKLINQSLERVKEAYEELDSIHTALYQTEKALENSYSQLEQQRNALEISEQRFKLAVEGAKEGIWDWDIENDILYFTNKEKNIYEYNEQNKKYIVEMWKDLLHPEDRERAISNLKQYLESGNGTYKDTFRIREKGGNDLWIFLRGQALWDKDGKAVRIVGSYTDITDQIELQEIFRELKEISDNIFENAPIVIGITDLQGRILNCNKYIEQITGIKSKDLIGTNWIDTIIPNENKAEMEQLLRNHQNADLVTSIETEIVCKGGQRITILWTNGFLYNQDGGIKAVLSMGVEITRQKDYEKKLYHLAYTNMLTKLPNRLWFEKELNGILNHAAYSNEKVALIYFDIDNLKYFNDTLGYSFGDKLLQYISNTLKSQIKKSYITAHMAGDDFVVLFRNTLDWEDIISRIDHLQKLLIGTATVEGKEVFISSSIGVAVYPEHGQDIETLLKNAETAMYCSKAEGKGRYSIFSDVLANKALQFNWMINELRKAIRNEEFMLYYQPLINLITGNIVGAEALIRWKHPIKGWISPAEFIPIAEASGLILDIGRWTLDKACKQKKMWNDIGYNDLLLSINLSSREFNDEKLFTNIKHLIEKYKLDSSNIQLEITETAAMADINASIKTVQQLKSLRLRVALDDFGTGYSSLNYLKLLPIDVIKLDNSFINSIEDENQDEKFLSTIIQLGQILNLEVVAEGVETKQQMEFLRKHSCSIGQGYLFSKPIPVGEFEFLLQSKNYLKK